MGFRVFRVVQQPCPPEAPGASRVSSCSGKHFALGTWHKLRVRRDEARRADWMQQAAGSRQQPVGVATIEGHLKLAATVAQAAAAAATVGAAAWVFKKCERKIKKMREKETNQRHKNMCIKEKRNANRKMLAAPAFPSRVESQCSLVWCGGTSLPVKSQFEF